MQNTPPLRRWALRLWAAALLSLFATLSLRALSPLARQWRTKDTGQPGQLSVFNSIPGGGLFGMPVEMGDYDGDGKIDLALAPMGANGANLTRPESGEVYVYPGTGEISGIIDRAALGDNPPGLTLWGPRAGDDFGTELYSADVNGDGITDLLIGDQNYDGPAGDRDSAGGAFIILGKPGLLAAPRTIDMASPPDGVITIVGARPGDRLGVWVEAGDLDGDGAADILIGADQAPGEDLFSPRFHAGEVIVIYGRRDFPAVIDLAHPIDSTTFILGEDAEDHFGSCLHANDLDGDGRAELIASAALNRLSATRNSSDRFAGTTHGSGAGDGPSNERPDCGEVHVFSSLGPGKRLPPLIDLSQGIPEELRDKHTIIYGAEPQVACGEEITTGDFNGDGFRDLALGALIGTNPQGFITGTVHVIYWRPGLGGQTIDLAPGAPAGIPEGVAVSKLYALRKLDLLGDTLSAGDFDHDGFTDLAAGIPMHDLDPVKDVGLVAIAFGRREPWPPEWAPQSDVLPPALRVAYVLGPEGPVDLLSYSMEAADYDGDGYADLFPNAMKGDGFNDLRTDAGEAYLISGFRLTGAVLTLADVLPPSGPVASASPVVILGSGFTTPADMRVLFDGVPASDVYVRNASRIEANAPPRGTPGKVDVRVETRYGSETLPGGFEYISVVVGFIRGDSDLNGRLDISDPILTARGLFTLASLPCQDASDSDDSGVLDITDPIYTLNYLFLGGPPPRPPFPEPGEDTTPDELTCR